MLYARPEFRSYRDGIGFRGGRHLPSERARDRLAFDALRAAASEVLAGLTMEDTAVCCLAERSFAWHRGATPRAVVPGGDGHILAVPELLAVPIPVHAEAVAAASRLCNLQYPFSWAQARCAARDLGAATLYRMLTVWSEHGLIVDPSCPRTP
jgi:hypothetical protein